MCASAPVNGYPYDNWTCPWVGPDQVCTQPETDLTTLSDRKFDPPPIAKKHGLVWFRVGWIASVSIKTDGVATVVRTGPILTNLVEILLDLA